MRTLACIAFLASLAHAATARDYFVDARTGDDSRSGRTAATAWRSLERVNATTFAPGDWIRFHTGQSWSGNLEPHGSGTPEAPVRWGAYGHGPRPRLEAPAEVEDVVLLRNLQHVELRSLELVHHGGTNAPRRGVHIVADNCGTLTGITVADLFIHDIHGTQQKKDNGGIIFRTRGERVPSRFDGLRIERNIVWRVDRSGIAADSYHARRTRWFPSLHVVIRDNWVGDVGGDGIVPWATDGALVEHNILAGANERAGSYNAGIWPWSTDNTILRLNRASGVRTLRDGQGFDADYNCRNTLLEFNLSHDNEGGFLLVCTPGQRVAAENLGNVGTRVRHNISRHDRARIFHVSAAQGTRIEHNAIYVDETQDVQMLLLSDWSGWARGLELRHNLFSVRGTARYGHGTNGTPDGRYGLAPGWGPAEDIRFAGNRYLGRHLDAPVEPGGPDRLAPRPIRFGDWPGPQFDPRFPERFPAYLRAHRAWMRRLMERQFGASPPPA